MCKVILKYKGLFLIIFLFIFLRLYFLINDVRIWWDSVVNLATADWLLSKKYYIEFFRPPVWPIVLAMTGSIFGVSFALERILSFGFSLASVIIMYFGLKYTYQKLAFYSIFMLTVFPFNIIFSYRLYESFSIFMNTTVLMTFLFFMKTKKTKFLFASGVLLGIAVLTKYIAGIFILFYALFFLIKKMKKQLTVFFVSFCLPLIPWFLFFWINFANPLYPLIENFAVTFSKPSGEWYSMLLYMPEVFGLGIFLIILSFRKSDTLQKVSLIITAIFLIIFSVASYKEDRYLLVLTPIIAIASAKGLLSLKKNIRIVLMLTMILTLGLLYTIRFTPETYYNISNLLSELRGNILTTDSPLVSFTLKRSSNQISMLKLIDPCEDIKKYNVTYVLFSTREDWFKKNKEFYLQKLDGCSTIIKEVDFGFEQYYIFKPELKIE